MHISYANNNETSLLYASSSNLHIQKSIFLVTESDFAVRVFCRDVEMNTIEDNNIPKHVPDQNTLEILMENMKKIDTE